MKLEKYRVYNFRSIEDSGWVNCDDITTLVGINESGKSNLLLALWKLNPARGGNIDILHDLPVSKLSSLRDKCSETKFVEAEFSVDDETAKQLSEELNCNCEKNTKVVIRRFYDGEYDIQFPNGLPKCNIPIKCNSVENQDTDKQQEEIYSEEDFNEKLTDALLQKMPKFVYYSNYGNLTSKIYLPHAVKWINGEKVEGLEPKEEQIRTLKVLFEFVHLKPEEIRELGTDPKVLAIQRSGNVNKEPEEKDIKKAENDREKRSILLQSASGELTEKFRNWWKQGEYNFRFQADGDYFRIWVSDAIRTADVDLELRSTGLQWFLSFFLIFLVESQESHKNAILLLDEAGLTLHPLAQRDLCKFFNNLAKENQIINTTHSPFIVDTDNIDRCRVVYSNEQGFTKCSRNLRENIGALADKSIYAVHAALGLSVSDILLQGCQAVIVEGVSDQYYLNSIKNYLVSKNLIAPKVDIIFVPCGGVTGVPGVASLLTGRDGKLPIVLVDSDESGKNAQNKLKNGLYKNNGTILEIGNFTTIENAEIEDLIPYSCLSKGVDVLFHLVDEKSFEDSFNKNKSIVPQIEEFAKANNVNLQKGWKVEVAKKAKLKMQGKETTIDELYCEKWKKLFETIISNGN